MMTENRIIDFKSIDAYLELVNTLQRDIGHIPLSLPRSMRLPFMAALREDMACPIIFVTSRPDRLLAMHEEFGFWTSSQDHLIFPEPIPLFYEKAAWDTETKKERLTTIVKLVSTQIPYLEKSPIQPIIFTSAKSLMTKTAPLRIFILACHTVSVDDNINLEEMVRIWVSTGYESAENVVTRGQFSRRGGLLDIWPVNYTNPVRIEFFGNKIETIRSFEPSSQRSVSRVDQVFIPPAIEAINLEPGMEIPLDYDAYPEFFIPTLYRQCGSFLDYLPKNSLVLLDNSASISATAEELENQAVKNRATQQSESLIEEDFPNPYLAWSEISDQFSGFNVIDLGFPLDLEKHPLSNVFHPAPRFGGKLDDFMQFIRKHATSSSDVYIVSKQLERIKEILDESMLDALNPVEGSLNAGWVADYPDGRSSYLFTDNELFGWERPQPRRKQRDFHQSPEFTYADLKPGAYVVHIDYGIGVFSGLVHRSLGGVERDYLLIRYADDDQLFVPIHQADRLNTYIGPDERVPRLSRLGGADWQLTKEKVRGAVREVAGEMLELYARRQTAHGFAYQEDVSWQKILESSFPYEETPDQIKAIREVKADLENNKPMDRLLCGDVGYGKTEVALRAAFKVVMNGRQVAILVPTTVLAQQHFETFQSRLAPFPVKVEMLSRFKSSSEQEEILIRLALGEIDIVIGTHRLLQPDVEFKDLGLLVIDEEQRFGVTHKEYFKKKRTEIDVLTLTATPIPRTLYMALSGIRDISVINTAPSDRLPIQTHVGGYDPKIVRQAIMREIDRGGQVFFVHNRVQTINAMASHLEKIVPEARISIAHGQMPEKDLAEVMRRFTAGEVDVLLSTSIIESGLDIPNANTLIVDRGDTFGLSQLYQLRGRVGRAASHAYAYFFHHRKKAPTPDGLERLETIAENTQLGAGYSIAMRDLEMRGAGDLLGTMQHGHIAAIGFHLYTRMLAQAVAEVKKDGRVAADLTTVLPQKVLIPLVTVDLPFSVGVPPDYIPDEFLRLQIYRRIADLRDISEIEPLKEEFIDRFGPLPEEIKNLFTQIQIKLKSEACGIASVSMDGDFIALRYPALPPDIKEREIPDLAVPIRKGKNAFWLPLDKENKWMALLDSALDELLEIKQGIS